MITMTRRTARGLWGSCAPCLREQSADAAGGAALDEETPGESGSVAATLAEAGSDDKRRRLAQLAEQVRRVQHERRGPVRRCASGWPRLDAALGGGFVCGAVHELVAGQSAATTLTIALRVAARALLTTEVLPQAKQTQPGAESHVAARAPRGERTGKMPIPQRNQTGAAVPQSSNRDGSWLLYVDAADDLYPPAAAVLGVPLSRLLVIRVRRALDVQWICEQALRCAAVAAVIAPAARLDAYASRRLQLAAEASGSLGLLLRSDEPRGHTFAASRLRIDPAPSSTGDMCVRVAVLKVREGRPAEPFVMTLSDELTLSRSSQGKRGVWVGAG